MLARATMILMVRSTWVASSPFECIWYGILDGTVGGGVSQMYLISIVGDKLVVGGAADDTSAPVSS